MLTRSKNIFKKSSLIKPLPVDKDNVKASLTNTTTTTTEQCHHHKIFFLDDHILKCIFCSQVWTRFGSDLQLYGVVSCNVPTTTCQHDWVQASKFMNPKKFCCKCKHLKCDDCSNIWKPNTESEIFAFASSQCPHC